MRSGQWERGLVVVENHVAIAGRMAGQTSRVLIDITSDAVVFVIGVGIQVADNARKFRKVTGIGMTLRTLVPNPFVRPAVNGEVLRIVVGKSGRHPPDIRCMAGGTFIREACLYVIGIGCIFKISLVTSQAIGRSLGERASGVAGCAIVNLMPLGQWEKRMVYRLSRPLESINLMAILTIDRKPGILMVRVDRIRKITAVTIDTGIADSIEFQARF